MNGKFDIVRLDWEERFGIASVERTWRFVLEILKNV